MNAEVWKAGKRVEFGKEEGDARRWKRRRIENSGLRLEMWGPGKTTF
jgi:hypothetical protein